MGKAGILMAENEININESQEQDEQKQKKTPMEIVNIVVNCVFYVIIFILLLFSITQIAGSKKGKVKNVFGLGYEVVLSNSMMPEDHSYAKKSSFDKNDLIWVNTLSGKEKSKLKKGDVITFWDTYSPNPTNEVGGFLNTHRIVDVIKNHEGKVTAYITQGDIYLGTWLQYDTYIADNGADSVGFLCSSSANYACQNISVDLVKAKYIGHWDGAGSFINWVSNPKKGFIVVILLPTIAFLLFEIFMVVKNMFALKTEKVAANAEEEKQKIRNELQAEKDKLREELLAELRKEQAQQQEQNVEAETTTQEENIEEEKTPEDGE